MKVSEYFRELAGAQPGESNRTAFQRLLKANGGPLSLSLATVYRYCEENNCADNARAVFDALDAARAERGDVALTVADFRNLTAGASAPEATP